MSFDKEAFTAEMDTMLDAIEADGTGVVPDEASSEGGEVEKDVANEKPEEGAEDGGDSAVDGDVGSGGDTATLEAKTDGGDGPAGAEGTSEDGGDNGEAAGGVTPSTISDFAIEQAVRAGISIADAKSFGNEESLLRVVDSVQKRSASEQSTEQEAGNETDDLDDLISKIPDLDPEAFRPEVVTMFGAMKDIIQQQQESIRDIRDQQGVASEARLQSSREEVAGWFDSEVSGLGKDFTEALGEGGYDSLPKGSSQLAKRDEIATNMDVMLRGYVASGRKAPPRGEVFKTAARIVLHDEFKQQANSEVAGKLEKRSSSHIQRGSGKQTKSQLTPEEETVQILDRKYPPQR